MSKENKIAVYGSGGYAREVMPLLKQEESYFMVDEEYITDTVINDKEVLTVDYYFSLGGQKVVIAIGSPKIRKELVEKCKKFTSQVSFPNVIAQNVVLLTHNEFSEGLILSPFCTVTSNSIIGKHFHGNLYSYIGHDCTIGDFVTFSPGVKCSGFVHIGDNVFVGTGAIIRPGTKDKPLKIGDNVTIGMGSVVTKDIPSGATVFGNPAKIIKRG